MFISISDEPDIKRLVHHYNNPYMPRKVDNPYYTLEIYECDNGTLDKIMQLIPLLEKQFGKNNDEYLLEATTSGFKLKKKISGGVYNQDSWDRWIEFSNSLYNEIAKAAGIQADN